MKFVLKWFSIGIGIGIFLCIIQEVLGLGEVFILYSCLICLVILVGILIYYFYLQSYRRKLRKFTHPLDSEEAEVYISEIERLLQTAKGRNLRNALKISLAAGYILVNQFETAVHILEGMGMAHERLRINKQRLYYLLNLYESYFGAGQYEKVMELYQANQKIFNSYRKDKAFGRNIAIMDIFAAIMTGQYELAERLLRVAQQTWTAPHLQDALEKMESFLLEMKTMDRP